MSRLHADMLLLFTAGIWGVAFLFQKSATAHLCPLTFLAMRGLVAFLALAPLAWREGQRAPSPARADFYLTSLLGGVAFLVATSARVAVIGAPARQERCRTSAGE